MNLGVPEMIFIFLLALLIFGPKKLPEIGRQIGRGLAEFKRASNELKSQIEDEMRLLETEEREKKLAPPPPPPEGTVASSGSSPEGTAALAAGTEASAGVQAAAGQASVEAAAGAQSESGSHGVDGA